MSNFNVNKLVTQKIIELLEQGTVPWSMPFDSSRQAVSWVTGKPYQGVNRWLLPKGEYLTFQQVVKNGGRVKKGSKSHIAVFWRIIKTKETEDRLNDDGKVEKVPVTRPMLRYFRLFEVGQCEGIEYKNLDNIQKVDKDHNLDEDGKKSMEMAKDIVQGFKYKPRYGVDSSAYYVPSTDELYMPQMDKFRNQESYYATFFHELIHATGHQTRLNRSGVVNSDGFGGKTYSFEELVAEMGASMLSGHVGFSEQIYENSASYINSWLRVLKGSPDMVVSASSLSEKAVTYILDNIDNVSLQDEINEQSVRTVITNVSEIILRKSKGLAGNVLKPYLKQNNILNQGMDIDMKDLTKEKLKTHVTNFTSDLEKHIERSELLATKITNDIGVKESKEIFIFSTKDETQTKLMEFSKGKSLEDTFNYFKTLYLDETKWKVDEDSVEKHFNNCTNLVFRKSDKINNIILKPYLEQGKPFDKFYQLAKETKDEQEYKELVNSYIGKLKMVNTIGLRYSKQLLNNLKNSYGEVNLIELISAPETLNHLSNEREIDLDIFQFENLEIEDNSFRKDVLDLVGELYVNLNQYVIDNLKTKDALKTAKYTKQDITRMERMKEWLELHKDKKFPVDITYVQKDKNVGGFQIIYTSEQGNHTYFITPREYYSMIDVPKRLILVPESYGSLIGVYENNFAKLLVKQGVPQEEFVFVRNVLDMVFDLRKRVR